MKFPAVTVTKQLSASPTEVFKAWTEPQLLEKWWCTPGYRLQDIRVDLQPSGRYWYQLVPEAGQEGPICTMEGQFHEVSIPHKLAYSWTIEAGDFKEADTQLEVSFNALGNDTELTLVHQGFQSKEGYELHELDWAIVLSNLEQLLVSSKVGNSTSS